MLVWYPFFFFGRTASLLKWVKYVEHFQVLRVVKTRQATYSILKHLSDYVQNLEKAGLLEEKEMFQLHEGVQVD